jgi:hypothetical protein
LRIAPFAVIGFVQRGVGEEIIWWIIRILRLTGCG